MRRLKLGLIGCGNMGGAIIQGVINKRLWTRADILVHDKDIAKMKALAKELECTAADLEQLVTTSSIVLIAVKPQDAAGLFKDISKLLKAQIIISVMAGVTIRSIEDMAGKKIAVARAMPNIDAMVGESMTSVSFNDLLVQKDEVLNIFSGIGKVLPIEESLLDAVTAVSGSGPAYLFYLAGAMLEAAEEMGIGGERAREIVGETLYGSAKLLADSGASPAELISRVASKGGTTEAALSVFESEGLKKIVKKAILKAKKRAGELSRR